MNANRRVVQQLVPQDAKENLVKLLRPPKFDIVELHNMTLVVRSLTGSLADSFSLRFGQEMKSSTTKVVFYRHNRRSFRVELRRGDFATNVIFYLRIIVEHLPVINSLNISSRWFSLENLNGFDLTKTVNLIINQHHRRDFVRTAYITQITDSVYINCLNLRVSQLIEWDAGDIQLTQLRIPTGDIRCYLQHFINGRLGIRIRLVRLTLEDKSAIDIKEFLLHMFHDCESYALVQSQHNASFVLFEEGVRRRVADVYISPTIIAIYIVEKEDIPSISSSRRLQLAIQQYGTRFWYMN